VRPIAVVGNVALDTVDGSPLRIGGASYYAGQGLRMLGGPSQLVVRCAESDRAALLPQLIALGVPVAYRGGRSTVTFAIRYLNGEREMAVESVGDTWTPADARALAPLLRRVQWLHAGALLRSDFPAETLAELARGRRLSLDGQALVRPGRVGRLEFDADYDPEVLEHLTVLKLAEEEARVVVGEVDEASIAELGVPEVLVTYGLRGSIVFAQGRSTEVPAHPVYDVEPTGAGDAYAAGYVAGRSAGLAPPSAARRATALVAQLLAARRFGS
jgi:sugar/nucleoside kinase (ribokinase family)